MSRPATTLSFGRHKSASDGGVNWRAVSAPARAQRAKSAMSRPTSIGGHHASSRPKTGAPGRRTDPKMFNSRVKAWEEQY